VRAAVFAREGVVEVRDVPEPSIVRDDDVIVRVAACGICGSDLRALAVPPQMRFDEGVVMGHELVGEVVDAGPAAADLLGLRVVVLPNIHCGRCAYCKAGQVDRCDHFEHLGATRDGAFAERMVVPAAFVHLVPDGLSDDVAALAEPLACVLNGTTRAGLRPGTSTVVLGAGPIGLLFVVVAKAAGAHPIIVSEPSEERARRALEAGADVIVDPTRERIADVARAHTGGLGAEVVIDALGSLLGDALDSLRKGGKAIVFGLDDRARNEIAPSQIASRELSIEGVYITKGTFPLALRLLAERTEEFARLITDRVPLDEVSSGVAAMREGRAIKVLVYPPDRSGS
jgi:(R,R)-butanediol dehydrogenase/meso-butanediol dehydrogenase/diacetyl reductase